MIKRLLLLTFIITFFQTGLQAQFSVGYHQSGVSFVEFAYEIREKIVPSARLGMNQYFDDVYLEVNGLYQFIDKEDYEIYAGAGFRFGDEVDFVIPVGVNLFPFEEKKFGFHIEAAPLIGYLDVLRGSFGIRYRFVSGQGTE